MSSMKALSTLVASAVMFIGGDARGTDQERTLLPVYATQSVSGPADITIHAEEPVEGEFVGFFRVRVHTVSLDSETPVRTEIGRGNVALTFDNWSRRAAGQPTQLSGLSVFDHHKLPRKMKLTLHPRNDDHRLFHVTLTGFSEADLVGVAVVDSKSVTMRLQDGTSQTTIVTLTRQVSSPRATPPTDAAKTTLDQNGDSGTAKPLVPNGLPSY